MIVNLSKYAYKNLKVFTELSTTTKIIFDELPWTQPRVRVSNLQNLNKFLKQMFLCNLALKCYQQSVKVITKCFDLR